MVTPMHTTAAPTTPVPREAKSGSGSNPAPPRDPWNSIWWQTRCPPDNPRNRLNYLNEMRSENRHEHNDAHRSHRPVLTLFVKGTPTMPLFMWIFYLLGIGGVPGTGLFG